MVKYTLDVTLLINTKIINDKFLNISVRRVGSSTPTKGVPVVPHIGCTLVPDWGLRRLSQKVLEHFVQHAMDAC